MKHILTALIVSVTAAAFGQASVAYYPFNSVVSVSTNADRAFWVDARFQTNTAFESLSTTLCPLINVVRREQVNKNKGEVDLYNNIKRLYSRDVLERYSLHFGVRAKVPFIPNLRAAFEISPYSRKDFKYGIMQTYLGLAYQFSKK